jgi:flagellar protein FliS
MWQNARDAYLESQIMTASPIDLVRLLYQGAIAAVRDARRHLAAGDIAARTASINKASSILIELGSSLDHARGGEISLRLGRLYDYMIRRLMEGNFHKADGPLAEVLGLLTTLSKGWDGVRQQQAQAAETASAVAGSPWSQGGEAPQTSQGWSL